MLLLSHPKSLKKLSKGVRHNQVPGSSFTSTSVSKSALQMLLRCFGLLLGHFFQILPRNVYIYHKTRKIRRVHSFLKYMKSYRNIFWFMFSLCEQLQYVRNVITYEGLLLFNNYSVASVCYTTMWISTVEASPAPPVTQPH